ncbi:histidine kinase sensor of two-component system, partial [Bifidobacterium italicum]
MHAHRVIVVDALETMCLMLLWILQTGGFAWNDGAGLVFDYPPSSAGAVAACTVWSALLTAPYMLHRTRPELAVRLFVAVVAAQLVCGPSLILADFMAVPMLCAAIVYGERGHLRRYLATAAVFDVLTALVNAAVQLFGPLLRRPRDERFGAIVFPCRIGAGGDHCGAQFTQAFVIVLFTVSLPLAMAVVVAFWQRARHQTVRLLNECNEAIVAREREERQIAASAERARIARDMHDIVAHTLSIIIIQSDGGRYAARDDPKLARETMETIRRESEHALHDMKRLLGVFGGSEHARLADVDALVEQARAVCTDMTITMRTLGRPHMDDLDERSSVAMYHVVQEALTNIRKYAGAKTH